jgi:hypothetical protein
MGFSLQCACLLRQPSRFLFMTFPENLEIIYKSATEKGQKEYKKNRY